MTGNRALPDCRACDAARTLEIVRIEVGHVAVAVCSCCAREVRIALAEALGEPDPVTDVSGNVMSGP